MPRRGGTTNGFTVTLLTASLLVPTFTASTSFADNKQACVTASDDAQKLRDERKLTKAREQLLSCARDVCPGVVRKDCLQWLSEVEASLPSIVLSARNAEGGDLSSAKVSVDGVLVSDKLDGKSIFIDPGPHSFRFEVDGHPPVEQQAVVREGEKFRAITATFGGTASAATGSTSTSTSTSTGTSTVTTPPPPDTGDSNKNDAPVAGYIVGGVGVLALGSFVFFGLSGKGDVSTLRDGCGQTHSCAQSDVDAARSKLIVADISLGVGVVALGVATYTILTHRSGSASAASPTALHHRVDQRVDLGARALPGGAAATVGGVF